MTARFLDALSERPDLRESGTMFAISSRCCIRCGRRVPVFLIPVLAMLGRVIAALPAVIHAVKLDVVTAEVRLGALPFRKPRLLAQCA